MSVSVLSHHEEADKDDTRGLALNVTPHRAECGITSLMTPHPYSEDPRRDVFALGELSSKRVLRSKLLKAALDRIREDCWYFCSGRYILQRWVTGTVAIPNRDKRHLVITLSKPVIPTDELEPKASR